MSSAYKGLPPQGNLLADDDTNLMLSEGDSHGKDCWGGDGRNLDVDGDMHE